MKKQTEKNNPVTRIFRSVWSVNMGYHNFKHEKLLKSSSITTINLV